MSELKQREAEFEADALRINAGRKPKFGDLMRNPWASESNPQRDGYFVRERRQCGRFNPGHYYEFTDKCGKFWETNAKYAFFIDTQPEATKPAQDLVAAILAMNRAKLLPIWDNDVPHKLHVELDVIFKALAALASPADALVAGDRVDALEKAAQACDQQADGTNGAYRTACLQCANAVRELRDAAIRSKKGEAWNG